MSNYLSPIFELRLISPRGKEMMVGAPRSTRQRSMLDVVVESISVMLSMGMVNEISVTLSAARDVIDRVLTENLEFFLPGGFLAVRLGYADGAMTQEFSGVLQPVNASFSDQGIQLSLTAKGGLWYSARQTSERTFKNDSVLDCIKQVCADHGTDVYYLSPDQGEIPFTRSIGEKLAISQKIDILNPVFDTFSQRDWFTVKTLVNERAKMRFYVSGQRIVLFSMAEQAIVTKAPKFVYAMPFDLERGIYPMLSFSPSNSEYPITAGLRELIARDIDPDDKTLFEMIRSRTSPDVDAPYTKSAGLPDQGRQFGGDAAPASGALERSLQPGSARDASPDGKMVRAKNIGEEQGGITASWEIVGDPRVTPGRLCSVEGVTPLFSGNYFVKEVAYQYDLSGFMATVTGFTMGFATNPYEFFKTASAQADQNLEGEQRSAATQLVRSPQ